MSLEISQIYPVDDTFCRLVCDPAFYGSIEAAHREIERHEGVLNSMGTAEAVNVELALIRIKRVRLILDTQQALHRLEAIGSLVEDDPLLSLKYRIVKAELALYKKGDYRDTESELESIANILRSSPHQFLYAMVAQSLAVAYMMLGKLWQADDMCQDSISISRRVGYQLHYAYSLNNYSVIKKKLCQYTESERLLKKALAVFACIGVDEGKIYIYNNLALLKMKMGSLNDAEYYLRKGIEVREQHGWYSHYNNRFANNYDINLMHLLVIRREFDRVPAFADSLNKNRPRHTKKQIALVHEFVAELYIEAGRPEDASNDLAKAEEIILQIAPESDVMTEIKRRKAQVCLLKVDFNQAKRLALDCVHLCKKISDRHEMGPALRILGEIYAHEGLDRKATATFEAGINTLKSIGECYELMRSCIVYSEFLIERGSADADIYLLEAKQLCKKLEIDYFMSQILLLSGRYAHNNGDFVTARMYLNKAEQLAESQQECDRKRLLPKIKKFYKELEKSILQSSMESAQKLKSLGKIYEDARFPIDELKPEMALEVARNVGAESLFLIRKKNKGFRVPLKYNIGLDDAKRMIRFQLRSVDLFQTKDPSVIVQPSGKTLVCVPGHGGKGYLLCTVIDEGRTFTPRELEFLFASVGAMERAAEEYKETPLDLDLDDFIEGGDGKLSHPGGEFKKIITLHPEMMKIIHLAERASQTNVPVLLEGETGVGKELFAQAVHAHSPRKDRQFIAINAGGVPLNLLESQLFGHVRGAFTDAVMDRKGLIEEAKGGTIFFDEVGEMCEELQVKLLRLLENGEFRRLGDNALRYAEVRVVSATNKDLQTLVQEGRFREDLYYRLAMVKFRIPALRDRKRDIEFLVRHFLNEGLVKIGKPRRAVSVDVKALEAFELYDWPGNVRELRNEILRNLSLIGEGEVIRFGMLSERIKDAFKSKSDGGLLNQRVERFERRLILKALEENNWNRIRTAEQIGIPRTTLIFKMKRLNIVS